MKKGGGGACLTDRFSNISRACDPSGTTERTWAWSGQGAAAVGAASVAGPTDPAVPPSSNSQRSGATIRANVAGPPWTDTAHARPGPARWQTGSERAHGWVGVDDSDLAWPDTLLAHGAAHARLRPQATRPTSCGWHRARCQSTAPDARPGRPWYGSRCQHRPAASGPAS